MPSLQIWPKNCKIVMLLSAMHLNRPWTRLTEAWGACKAQWNCKFPERSSTALCKQRSPDCKSQEIQEMQCGIRDAANSRCCLHQYAPPQRSNAYLCWSQILQKRYKLNWNAEDSMRRKIGNNAILQEIMKMELVTGDVANSWCWFSRNPESPG